MTTHSKAFYERRIKQLEKESARLQGMLADVCKVIEKNGFMKLLPAESRDFWGNHRAKKRGKEPAGHECFKS